MISTLFKRVVLFSLERYRRFKVHLTSFCFDFFYGIDTWRPVSIETLGTDPTLCYGYEATEWVSFKSVLERLDVKSTDTFLDLGSGKGRALLIASEFPFRKIIGVEISRALCEVAYKNVERYLQQENVRCSQIEIVNSNAFNYRIPSEVSVLYFADPFPSKTLDAVLSHLLDSFQINQRRILIIYGGNEFCGKFAVLPSIKEFSDLSGHRFYKIYELSRTAL